MFNGRLISGVSSGVTATNVSIHFLTVAQCYSAASQIFAQHGRLRRSFLRKLQAEVNRLSVYQENEHEADNMDEARSTIQQDGFRQFTQKLARKRAAKRRKVFIPVELLEVLAQQHYYEERSYVVVGISVISTVWE